MPDPTSPEESARCCVECRVRWPHEHRCLEGGCECPDCHPTDAELEAFRREVSTGLQPISGSEEDS